MERRATNLIKGFQGHFGHDAHLRSNPESLFSEDVIMREIQLANNRGVALVDDSDFEAVSKHKWHILKQKHTSYATAHSYRNGKRTSTSMHRLIMGEPKDKEVDHRDGDGLNNQRFNLRVCTRSQNMMNQRKARGTSQYKGVSWYEKHSKWRAKIEKDGKSVHLCYRDTELECARMYDTAAIELFGEFANINFKKEI